jgi:UDP-N-acetylmuramoyl-L-alanyl-D-glutamate--2,6-diaminopimelate ligase
MATVNQIMAVLPESTLAGPASTEIRGITHDSRKAGPGVIFVAMKGEVTDGHDYIYGALKADASGIIAERPRFEDVDVPWITVPDSRAALGPAAAAVHGFPTRKMTLIGITGTNGKTTLTYLLESIIKAHGGIPGVVGTVSYRWLGREMAASHTTPEACELQELFASMVKDSVTHALIEVSSHGLHRGRLDGCDFDLGVFTNLTQDHLDYHGTFEEYFQSKKILFERFLPLSSKGRKAAVVNLDDPYGERLRSEIKNLPVISFGASDRCDFHPDKVAISAQGIQGNIAVPGGEVAIRSPLTGHFNLSNIMAAVATATAIGIPKAAIQAGIEAVSLVPGRVERVSSEKGTILVDYAHTPNALKNVLEALAGIRTGRIITIMGCGGDRDRTKRPLMGMEAAVGSDFVVVTSDNPRSEDPLEIMTEIEKGIVEYGFTRLENGSPEDLSPRGYAMIPDRREAIAWALRTLRNGDILLLAGKGHETYQEIKGIRYPFDDRQVVREELKKSEL